jgi:RNA polymerase sigma-70 factor (ECF subfamily)
MASAPPDEGFGPRSSSESFPVTRWSLVGRAGLGGEQDARRALGTLLQRYLPALRSHLVARKRIRPDDADELLQGFVAGKVLERNLIGSADQSRGKFRSFLLTALDRYVIDEQRRQAALKRRPTGDELEALDQPARGQSPSRAFDLEWARQVLADAMGRMREECQRSGRNDLWEIFQERLVLPATEGAEPMPYEALVSRYGIQSPAQASNLMITSKRMFARHLRAVVGQYVDEPGEIDAELRDLRRIASARP